jgi:putative addiction module killer protein
MFELRGYVDRTGVPRFAAWFESLDSTVAAKVVIALSRMEQGNFSSAKGVGAGVYEYRINFGPGVRIYFGRDGERLVILLGGGSKKQQAKDIAAAKERWTEYKRRKKTET